MADDRGDGCGIFHLVFRDMKRDGLKIWEKAGPGFYVAQLEDKGGGPRFAVKIQIEKVVTVGIGDPLDLEEAEKRGQQEVAVAWLEMMRELRAWLNNPK